MTNRNHNIGRYNYYRCRYDLSKDQIASTSASGLIAVTKMNIIIKMNITTGGNKIVYLTFLHLLENEKN